MATRIGRRDRRNRAHYGRTYAPTPRALLDVAGAARYPWVGKYTRTAAAHDAGRARPQGWRNHRKVQA